MHEALAAEAARLAGALGDLLAGLTGAQDDTFCELSAFLHRMAGDHAGARLDDDHPLPRLHAALALSALEQDLVVLAGLPDEHEGYAGVLRRLHPDGLARPTAGLAAQLLCPSPADRYALRAALVAGPAVRHGLLRLGGEGPLPERTLELPPGLWHELAGIPAPAPEPPPVVAGLDGWLASPPVARAVRAVAGATPCTVLLADDDDDAAHERALALVAAAGRPALAVQPRDDAGALALRALARDAVPVVALPAPEPGHAAEDAPLAGHPGPVVLCARPGAASGLGERPLIALAPEPLTVRARRAMWAHLLPELAGAAGDLAARHLIEPAAAARVAIDVRARAALDGRAPAPGDVAAGVRARAASADGRRRPSAPPVARPRRLGLPA
jgi:hypothetical protein